MIHVSTGPAAGVMAVITAFTGGEVGRVLASGNAAIVTTCTAADYLGVIDAGNCPAAGAVAGVTGGRRLDMAGVFAGGGAAIMATHTAAADI